MRLAALALVLQPAHLILPHNLTRCLGERRPPVRCSFFHGFNFTACLEGLGAALAA